MKSILGFVWGCAVFSCTPTFADVVQYGSQSSFVAAAGSVLSESFDSISSDVSFRSTPVTVGNLTLSGFGSSQDAFNIVDAVPSAITGFSINGTTQVTVITAPTDTGFTIRFAQPILGFGATFFSLQAPNSLLRTQILAAGSVLTPPLLSTNAASFFGFTSDVPFSEVSFQNANPLVLDSFAFDNVLYSPAPAVPEASTAALLLLGICGLMSLRMGRRGQHLA